MKLASLEFVRFLAHERYRQDKSDKDISSESEDCQNPSLSLSPSFTWSNMSHKNKERQREQSF